MIPLISGGTHRCTPTGRDVDSIRIHTKWGTLMGSVQMSARKR